ncbi:MAG: hypothetical protein ACI8W8_001021 [Rhodothermales bacterium]|jgi:hypothetical protein
MKQLTTILLAAFIAIGTISSVSAKEEKAKKPAKEKNEKAKKAKVELVDLELKGTLSKKERTVKNKKDNTEKTVTAYFVTTENGVVRLPSKDANFADLVDKEVIVTGKGHSKGEGKKARTYIKKDVEVKAAE